MLQALAGPNGLTWFLTDARSKVPPGQAAATTGSNGHVDAGYQVEPGK